MKDSSKTKVNNNSSIDLLKKLEIVSNLYRLEIDRLEEFDLFY